MKYTVAVKFIAIMLTACALVVMAGGIFGIGLSGSLDLYTNTLQTLQDKDNEETAEYLAREVLPRFTAKHLSDLPKEILASDRYRFDYSNTDINSWRDLVEGSWGYSIRNAGGTVLESLEPSSGSNIQLYRFTLSARYPIDAGVIADGESRYTDNAYMDSDGQLHIFEFVDSPKYTVDVSLAVDLTTTCLGLPIPILHTLHTFRYAFIAAAAVGFLLFAAGAVYLCCAAGQTEKGAPVAPAGLNRLPLDLYATMVFVGCMILVILLTEGIQNNWRHPSASTMYVVGFTIIVPACLLIALSITGLIFAVAAQCKMRGFYWWRHSVIGWLCCKIWRGIRMVLRGCYRLLELLPLIWRWLLIGAVMGICLLFTMALAFSEYFYLPLFGTILGGIILVSYGGYAFGTLLKGAKQMADGALNTKIPTKYLIGSFAQCAGHLNTLADVVMVAAKNQMRSEHMKTELITNVSHDIKTPLTSIINYVDLLQQTENPQQRQEYLEVLNRQSLRMKKLIEDLMDMSKAATGNMNVEITQVDAVEAVTQALGEFSDKLAAVNVTPVFRQSAQSLAVMADGRLLWRVLSNLLSNAVKYAMPGTRMYVDLVQIHSQVLISLKNISREELNISAEELTERFVRGDVSRNTEGSGLGLNIAKSLMELQHGSLELLVDGDLFKVTLYFPAA